MGKDKWYTKVWEWYKEQNIGLKAVIAFAVIVTPIALIQAALGS